MIKQIVVFGASITSSPWWTWKDFLEIESGLPVIDLSRRGVGNEYMAYSLLAAGLDENTLVVGMLTNVDKFDWYVQGNQYRDLQNEKHQPIPVSNDSGFWCTGSWFPLKKEIYKEHFFNLDYYCTKTIQQILLIKNICALKKSKIEIFFDSPIWDYTEQQLNNYVTDGIALEKMSMLDLPLSSHWKDFLSDLNKRFYENSLIGYCMDQKLLWYNQFYKAHPPSSSQWQFYNNIVKPAINQYVKTDTIDLTEKIRNFDQKWKEY